VPLQNSSSSSIGGKGNQAPQAVKTKSEKWVFSEKKRGQNRNGTFTDMAGILPKGTEVRGAKRRGIEAMLSGKRQVGGRSKAKGGGEIWLAIEEGELTVH